MKTRAAIAWEPNRPLEIEEIDLEGPKEGEVLVRIVTTSLCHTDVFTLSGEDPEGLFPCILGHEGCGIVEEVGKGVTSVVPGDHVIPLYVPEDPNCPYIKSGKTNLCQTIRATQGAGLMPMEPPVFPTGASKSCTTWAPAPSANTPSCRRFRWRRSPRMPLSPRHR